VGLISNHYTKEGPGVPDEEEQRSAFVRFWQYFGRRFTSLIKLNLLFVIPVAAAITLLFVFSTVINNEVLRNLMAFAPFILVAPFVAGLTYVTRNYARRDHAFIFSDFKDAVKENWKPFLIDGFICYVMFFVISIAMNYYGGQIANNKLFYVPYILCILLTFIFVSSHFYIPVMIVTFDLKLRQIYKNALLFTVIGLWRNIFLFVLLAAGVYGVSYLLTILEINLWVLLIVILLAIFILFSFVAFLINFTVYPLIDRLLIHPSQNQEDPAAAKKSKTNNDDIF